MFPWNHRWRKCFRRTWRTRVNGGTLSWQPRHAQRIVLEFVGMLCAYSRWGPTASQLITSSQFPHLHDLQSQQVWYLSEISNRRAKIQCSARWKMGLQDLPEGRYDNCPSHLFETRNGYISIKLWMKRYLREKGNKHGCSKTALNAHGSSTKGLKIVILFHKGFA